MRLLKNATKMNENFGNAWLKSSGKLTLHDPLAAVCMFYADVCKFEKDFVDVEIKDERSMGSTVFTADSSGNVEISREVDVERFYHILSSTLSA